MLKDVKIHWPNEYHYDEYAKDLSNEAEIEGIPEVFANIDSDLLTIASQNRFELYDYKYTIIDDKHFTREKIVTKCSAEN